MNKFIENYYPSPDNTKDILKTILEPIGKYKTKLSSSSKSVIILTKDSVFKLMKPVTISKELTEKSKVKELIKYNKEALPLLFNCSESFVVCIKSILTNKDINIVEYEKLYPIKKNYKLRKLLLMLYQISYALRNIHRKGYYHDDVYLNNIGCRRRVNECDFILYDFELSNAFTKGNESYEMYRDVKIFLDDLIKNYKDDILYKTFIENILNIINKNSIKETGETKTILKRVHKVYINIYEYNDFNKLILKLIKYYIENSKNIKDMVEYTSSL
jgi:hypothetical protein